jgi:23S rRNA pseudouridine1911/1915/1917 synthase
MSPAPLDILCEDGPVIGVNKPAGIVVQGAPTGVENLADLVREYLRRKYQKPGNVYLGVPHRLDRPVSGVVVFSRNSKCAARLSEQFAGRDVRKIYLAVVSGVPHPTAGELIDWLRVLPEDPRFSEGGPGDFYSLPKVVVAAEGEPEAKQASLGYRVVWSGGDRSLVEIELHTGRMHQIRVQLASRGWPILGDLQYGSRWFWEGDSPPRPSRAGDGGRYHPIALHAARLTLKHPVRYDELTIAAPPPRGWRDLGIPGEVLTAATTTTGAK